MSRSASHCAGFFVQVETKVPRRTSVVLKSWVSVPPEVRTVEWAMRVLPCSTCSVRTSQFSVCRLTSWPPMWMCSGSLAGRHASPHR